MFDHVTIRVSDRDASGRFYDTVLATLGIGRTSRAGETFTEWGGFSLAQATDERPEYHAGYHAAFVLDSDGNNVELVVHHRGG